MATTDDDSGAAMAVGWAASILALTGAGVGALRAWKHLGAAWGWLALVLGGLAIGAALVRLCTVDWRDIGPVWRGLCALGLGGAAVAGLASPWAPAIGLGAWLVLVVVPAAIVDG